MNDDVMEKTGKNNKLFVSSYDGPFLNSDAIIIEYEDVLESPELILLNAIYSKLMDISKLFDLSDLDKINTPEELSDFYINRRYKVLLENFKTSNILNNAILENNANKEDYLLDFTCELLNQLKSLLYDDNPKLNFYDVLNYISNQSLVKKIIVFSRYHGDFINNIFDGLQKEFPKVKFILNKSLNEIITEEKIPNNSTFVFSDIRYIEYLKYINKLDLASILIADGLGYNYIDNTKNDLVINISDFKNNLFKLNFFNNFYSIE